MLNDNDIFWIPHSKNTYIKSFFLGLLMFSMLIYFIFSLYDKIPFVVLGMGSVFIILTWFLMKVSKAISKGKVGIAGKWVFVDDGFGGKTKAHCSEIVFSPFVIVANEIGVFYAHPFFKEQIFKKEDINHLLAMCDNGNSISIHDMSKILQKIKQPVAMLSIKFVVFIIFIMLISILSTKYLSL